MTAFIDATFNVLAVIGALAVFFGLAYVGAWADHRERRRPRPPLRAVRDTEP